MSRTVNPGVSSSTTLLSRTAKDVSLFSGLSGLAYARPCPATPSSFYSISCRVGLRAPSYVGSREPTIRKIAHLCHSEKPKQIARRLTTRSASRQQYDVSQQSETVPVWLWICLASYRAGKDALQFLLEQPGQLKYIEWPSFQITIRMAMLTVVVVALLIIFLATIDSTFSYVLSSMLRRVP